MGEKTFREGNIHDDVYWSPKQKEGSMDRIEQIKQWHEYHGSCVDALLKGAITLEEFNLHEDEFDRFFDSLYSSQEPQKSEKQKVADLLGVPLSEVHTLDIQDGKLVEIVDVPQSVSTPTEGMELSNEEIDKKYGIKYLNDTITVKQAYEIRDAQLAKVLSNLPTKQGIREKTQDKIARDLYKIIADNNYDMASVIRYLDKIVKLKAGQSPKEV